jgi:putative transposase
MLGFKSFKAAQGTLAGVELLHMIRQGQLASGAEQGLTAAERFYSLAA